MLPHENPFADRAISGFLRALHNQAQAGPPPPVIDFRSMPYEALRQVVLSLEPMFTQLIASAVGAYPENAPPPEHIEIDSIDAQRLPIDVFRPTERRSGPLPCIVYCHGGGMAFGTPQAYRPFLQRMADLGAVVVAPYFRNSPAARYPAGVNDCLSAVLWVQQNKETLGIHRVTLAGESGGGLLALTVPLIAMRRGLEPSSLLDAVWADSPMCASAGNAGDTPLPSQIENDGYLLTRDQLLLVQRTYTDDIDDSCAFPLNADAAALRRLPRTMIVIHELDPLRDEALNFYRKLVAAGHPDAECMQLHGLMHAAMIFHSLKPEFSRRQLQRIIAFAT